MNDLFVPTNLRETRRTKAETLPKVLLTDIDLNWLQTSREGWAAALKGFMREGTLSETLHFNIVFVDPFNRQVETATIVDEGALSSDGTLGFEIEVNGTFRCPDGTSNCDIAEIGLYDIP